jgi:hypothetical protein
MWTIYYSGDLIEKTEIGVAFRKYGGNERCLQGSGAETRAKETPGKNQT